MTTFTFNLDPQPSALLTTNNARVVKQLINYIRLSNELAYLTTFFLKDDGTKNANKMDETNIECWNSLMNRDLFDFANKQMKILTSELTSLVVLDIATELKKENREYKLLDTNSEVVIAYLIDKVTATMTKDLEIVNAISPSIPKMNLAEYKAWNKTDTGFKATKAQNDCVYSYFRCNQELDYLKEVTSVDLETVISKLLTVSQYKSMFVKQEISVKGDQLKGQYLMEVLKSLMPSVLETTKYTTSKTRWLVADTADSFLFRNKTLFTYNEYVNKAYKFNTWTTPRDYYSPSDYFTKNANKDIYRLKTVNVMNAHLVGKLDSKARQAIKTLNATGVEILPSILDDETIKELILEDSIIKGLKRKQDRPEKLKRISELEVILRAKYSVMHSKPLYRDTRLDIVSGRMHGGMLQGSKVERQHKVGLVTKILTNKAREVIAEYTENELTGSYSKRLKAERLQQDLDSGTTRELIEIDATNQVMHILGTLLRDPRLMALGGGVINGDYVDAYTFMGEYLKEKITIIVKETAKKKAKKILKSDYFAHTFSRDNMKPLVMPIIYGKGITTSLYGSILERDNTLGYTLCKNKEDIDKAHSRLQEFNNEEEEMDFSVIPLYWQLQYISFDMISKEDLVILYKEAIATLSEKLLPFMTYLQKSFRHTKGSYEAVAYSIFGVSGVLQRKFKLSNEEQFHNTMSVKAEMEVNYSTVKQVKGISHNGRELSVYETKLYDCNKDSATVVTPSLATNIDSTLVRYVTNNVSCSIFQVYDAFYINPVDVQEVAMTYKLGLKWIGKQDILPSFVRQIGGTSQQALLINMNFQGQMNLNSIPKMSSLICV